MTLKIFKGGQMGIAVIGTGNMGQALVKGFIRGGVHKPDDIYIYDKDQEKVLAFAKNTGCRYFPDLKSAIELADTVLLAVKPQGMDDVVLEVNKYISSDAFIISIAAGITITHLRKLMGGTNSAIARVMPNTPALVGQGASAICFSKTSFEQEKYCVSLLESCGVVVIVSEEQMDAVTGISGSGPAYGMLFIEAMAQAGTELGLSPQDSLLLSAATLKGAAALILETGVSPKELTNRVCSPGGTTIEAVKSLERNEFNRIIKEAVNASAKRSEELAKEKK